jgi:prefoldin subunit 5
MTELELKEDIKKYEEELVRLQKQVEELDKRKAEIMRVGVRIEGAMAYIKAKLNALVKPEQGQSGNAS